MKKILALMISLTMIISMVFVQSAFAESDYNAATGATTQRACAQPEVDSTTGATVDPGEAWQPDADIQDNGETITIKVTVDEASEKLLANSDKCKMFISDGDQEVIAEKVDGVWEATLPAGEENNLTIGFAISREYFIPTIKVNGNAMQTFSWPSEDERLTNIGISMPMSEVGDGEFDLDLTFGKTANLDPEWLKLVSGITNMDVSYMIDDEGVEVVPDDVDVTFKAKDAAKDKLVTDSVATYDFSVLMDDQAQSELARPVDVTLELDKNQFTEDDYVVVRNHNGQREIIDSEYRADEHVLSFSSDKFSTYTVAKVGAKILPEEHGKKVDPSVNKNTNTNQSSAKGNIETGDMNNVVVPSIILILVLATSLISVIWFKRKRHHK